MRKKRDKKEYKNICVAKKKEAPVFALPSFSVLQRRRGELTPKFGLNTDATDKCNKCKFV